MGRRAMSGSHRLNWSSYDNVTGSSEVEVTEASPAANETVLIRNIEIKARTGSAAATLVQILDGSAGTVMWAMEFDALYGVVIDRDEAELELTQGNAPYIKMNQTADIDVNLGGTKVKN